MLRVEMTEKGVCSLRRLATLSCISPNTARKAVIYYESGTITPPKKNRGHGRTGVGQIIGLQMCHHECIFKTYLKNPAMPLIGYIDILQQKYDINVSEGLIRCWFKTIGDIFVTDGSVKNLVNST